MIFADQKLKSGPRHTEHRYIEKYKSNFKTFKVRELFNPLSILSYLSEKF